MVIIALAGWKKNFFLWENATVSQMKPFFKKISISWFKTSENWCFRRITFLLEVKLKTRCTKFSIAKKLGKCCFLYTLFLTCSVSLLSWIKFNLIQQYNYILMDAMKYFDRDFSKLILICEYYLPFIKSVPSSCASFNLFRIATSLVRCIRPSNFS